MHRPGCRILLVDDHPIVRVGLSEQLAGRRDLRVVGEAGSAAGAIELAAALRPDLVLLDISLPDESGVHACMQIVAGQPGVRILMMSVHDDAALVRGAITAGAHGYVLKDVSADTMLEAIRAVASGSSFIDPRLIGTVLNDVRALMSGGLREGVAGLSRQEQRILPLLAEGRTNKEIGSVLILSDKTVKNYLANMFAKLRIKSRSQAAALYMRSLQVRSCGASERILGSVGEEVR